MTTTATASPLNRIRRHIRNAALGIFLGVMLGSLALYSAWGVIVPAAVVAMVVSRLAITAIVIRRGGTQ